MAARRAAAHRATFLVIVLATFCALAAGIWSSRPSWMDAREYVTFLDSGRWTTHPPGFLFFMALGHLLRPWVRDAYFAMQVASLTGALLSIVLLHRALRTVVAEAPAALLTVAYAFSWIPLLMSTVGTSHAWDLAAGAALAAVLAQPGFWEGRPLPLAAFFATLGMAFGFRMTSVVMWVPAIAVTAAWHRRRPAYWIGAGALALAAVALLGITVALSGGWDAYATWAREAHAKNAPTSLAASGLSRGTLANAVRPLVWGAMQFSLLLPFVLRSGRGGLARDGRPPVTLALLASVVGPMVEMVLYHTPHPGYLTPIVPSAFVLAGVGWASMRPGRGLARVALVGGYLAVSLGMFYGFRVIREPRTDREALANAVFLQMSADGVKHGLFRTYTMWRAEVRDAPGGRASVPER